jgi:hypothetical protein
MGDWYDPENQPGSRVCSDDDATDCMRFESQRCELRVGNLPDACGAAGYGPRAGRSTDSNDNADENQNADNGQNADTSQADQNAGGDYQTIPPTILGPDDQSEPRQAPMNGYLQPVNPNQ